MSWLQEAAETVLFLMQNEDEELRVRPIAMGLTEEQMAAAVDLAVSMSLA